jgi:AbrB family looped-hinge helix DNA binding protein
MLESIGRRAKSIHALLTFSPSRPIINSRKVGISDLGGKDFIMLAELRPKAQITLPKAIVEKMGLSCGDKLDIFEKDGVIHILPVVVYPKKYVDVLNSEIKELKEKIVSGEQPVFESVDEMLKALEEN